MRYDSITEAIGNTPLVRLDPAVHGLRNIDLFAKLEMLNPWGSVKDRAAWSMARPLLSEAVEHGSRVVELSSGNTAKALAVVAGMHGLGFKSVTNRMRVPEIKDLLLLLGAEIEELPGQSECLDPTATDDPLTLFHRTLSASGSAYLHTDQYFNPRNTEAHLTGTGPEIVKDLDGRVPDWFVACVGTAGSSTGVARALREEDPSVRVVGLVAAKSDFIPGIRTIDEVQEVGLFDPETYDTMESVSADEAIEGMLTLNRRCGILGGPTGGAAYFGAVRHLRALDEESSEAPDGRVHRLRPGRELSELRPSAAARPAGPSRPEELPGRPDRGRGARGAVGQRGRRPAVGSTPTGRSWSTCAVRSRTRRCTSTGPSTSSTSCSPNSCGAACRCSRNRPVLLACPVGEQSARYAALLTRMGHADVRSLTGGIIAWRDAGAPLVRD
ncbi:hypothetical protein SPURM210S_05348 [Streptomyces purpurascens]